jgi:hypothetical protein
MVVHRDKITKLLSSMVVHIDQLTNVLSSIGGCNRH